MAKPIPDGFHAVMPYLVVNGAPGLIEFLKKTFGAQETERMNRPDGTIAHAEVKIGDSMVMLSDATPEYKPIPSMLYMYVRETDAVYDRALRAGASSLMAPADQFYGDRNAMVKDPSGNTWCIATHVEDVPADELRRRAALQKNS